VKPIYARSGCTHAWEGNVSCPTCFPHPDGMAGQPTERRPDTITITREQLRAALVSDFERPVREVESIIKAVFGPQVSK
jgi:hypothetical protein